MVNAEDTVIFDMHGPLPQVFVVDMIKRAHKASCHQEQLNRHHAISQRATSSCYYMKSDLPIQFIISAHA